MSMRDFGGDKVCRAMLKAMPDMIFLLDRNGTYLAVNSHDAGLLYRPKEDLIGRTIRDVLPENVADLAMTSIHDALETQEEQRFEYALQLEHELHFFEGRTAYCGDDAVIIIVRDITEIRKNEQELIRAKNTAEAANRAKSEFLANISHEIRTPLNAVLGFAELMEETDLDNQQREYADFILSRGNDLMGLMDDLLMLAQIEFGGVAFHVQPYDLRQNIDMLVAKMSPAAERKGLFLQCEIEEGVPHLVNGDEQHLRQALEHVIENAVKFTEKGGVKFVVSIIDAELVFEISDTGIGFSGDKTDFIFDCFTQVDGSFTRKYGGAGMGLALCREMVVAMKGRIWSTSEPGKGSHFYIAFPLDLEADTNDGDQHMPLSIRSRPA